MSGGKWGNPKFDSTPEVSEPGTMKAYKFEVLVIDFDQLGGEELARTIETNRYIDPRVESIEERDIGEWTDDHPLNKAGCSLEFHRLFGKFKVQVGADGIENRISVVDTNGGEVLRLRNPSEDALELARLWEQNQ